MLLVSSNTASAAGTNIAVSAASAFAGGLSHARERRVDWRIVLWMTPPSIVGAFVGGFFGSSIPSNVLLVGIAAVLLFSGLDMAFDLRASPKTHRPRLSASITGAVIGLLGGAVGLILGTLRMPALVRSVGLPPARAVGTNLVVGFFLGVAGFFGHVARLEVEWLLLAVSVAAALPGAWLGARFTGRLPEAVLKRAIGAALVVVAIVIALTVAL